MRALLTADSRSGSFLAQVIAAFMFVLLLLLVPMAGVFAMSEIDESMTFDIIYLNHTNIVVAEGTITSRTPTDFLVFLATQPFDGFRFVMALNSPGGDLGAALQLGLLVGASPLITTIEGYEIERKDGHVWDWSFKPAQCNGVCSLVFLGGSERDLAGTYDFAAYLRNRGETLSIIERESIRGYLKLNDVSPRAFDALLWATRDEPWRPLADEYGVLGIITPKAFSDFRLEPLRDGVVAYSIFDKNGSGREWVRQLTFYCRAGNGHLLLSQAGFQEARSAFVQDMLRNTPGDFVLVPASGTRIVIPASAVNIRSEGQPLFDIPLDEPALKALMQVDTRGYLQVPGVIGSYSFAIAATDADREAIRFALRHCID